VEGLVITWRELLVVASAILAVVLVKSLLARETGAAGWKLWRRSSSASTDAEVVNGLSLELSDLRKQVARLQSDLESVKSQTPRAVSPYNQAIHMARQGLSASEVASGCGISRGEAELIVALYRKLRI
jgi:hypothetical protein